MPRPSYSYNAFGLGICSEIEFDQLVPGAGKADVVVRLGQVPDRLKSPTGQGVLYQTVARQFLLNIDGVARFLVSNGSEILIDPAPNTDADTIRLFLFGSVFGALLHQRGVLLLHASAIVAPAGAVVFAGSSGCGKSTLACAFHQKGYLILADELCAIGTGVSLPVSPGNPFLMLWADALQRLGLDRLGLRAVRPNLEKYILPLGDDFATEATPLHAVYILEASNSRLSAPTPIKGLKKIEALTGTTYRPRFVEHMKHEGEHLRQITEVASRARVARVNRPHGSLQVDELVDLIQEDFRA